MNVVKVFSTTNHKKVAAKLHAYGFYIKLLTRRKAKCQDQY